MTIAPPLPPAVSPDICENRQRTQATIPYAPKRSAHQPALIQRVFPAQFVLSSPWSQSAASLHWRSLSLSLSLSHTHTHSLSLSLSLSHTHTHTHNTTSVEPGEEILGRCEALHSRVHLVRSLRELRNTRELSALRWLPHLHAKPYFLDE